MIKRYLQPIVEESLKQGLISVIYGARQTGKTTLSLEIAKKYPGFIYLNCDEPDVRLSLTNQNSVNLKSNYDLGLKWWSLLLTPYVNYKP